MTAELQQPSVDSTPSPVGHGGARVEIHERRSGSVRGWIGVLVIVVCIVAAVLLRRTTPRGLIAIPTAIGIVALISLVVVQPGQTRVIQFFGRYVGTVRRPGLSLGAAAERAPEGQRAGAQLRDQPPQGQRRRRQPGRDRRDRRLAGGRHRQGHLRGGRLPQLRARAGRVRAAARRHDPSLRRPRRRTAPRCAARPTSSPASWPHEVAQRVALAGVEIVEVRISHLAYAAEIAQAMLRRQQANAVVAARTRIVEGAVGMVELALAGSVSAASSTSTRNARPPW